MGNNETLHDYYLIIKKHLIFIIATTLLITTLTTIAVFVIKPTYESEASILIPKKDNNINSFFSKIGLDVTDSPLADMSYLNKDSNNVSDFVSILKSRYLAEKVIKNLKIENHEEIKVKDKKSFQAIIEKFQKKIKIFPPSQTNSVLKIKVRFKDSDLAIKVINRYFYELKKYLEETNYLSTTRNRKFIQQQLGKISKELKESEDNLFIFQKSNKTVLLPEEMKSYIKYISDLEAQELTSKIYLGEVSEKINSTNKNMPEFDKSWENFLKELQITESALKTRKNVLEVEKNKYQSLLNNLPNKAIILARLERDVTIKNALYLLFTQQLEIAKVEEAKELEPFKILDSAYTFDKPIFPKKKLTILISFVVGLSLSILGCILFEN